MKIYILLLINLTFLLPFVLCNISSSNYTISLIGNSQSTGIFTSNNYEGLFLSEKSGKTSNSETQSFTINIGFFENTTYQSNVEIVSYTISEKYAKTNSNIAFKTIAKNAKKIWAEIKLPNDNINTINLTNNEFFYYRINSLTGRYDITFYAQSYNNQITSISDYFEVSERENNINSGKSSTNNEIKIIEKCTSLWDCSPWSLCLNGTQKRVCTLIGNCSNVNEKPKEIINCNETLFDISIKLNNLNFTENKELLFIFELIDVFGTEKKDVYIKYSLIDSNYIEIFRQIETIAVEKNITIKKVLENIKLDDDIYNLRIEILYGNQQRAFTEQTFYIKQGKIYLKYPIEKEVEKNTEIKEESPKKNFELDYYFKITISIIFILIVLILFIISQKRTIDKITEKTEEIERK